MVAMDWTILGFDVDRRSLDRSNRWSDCPTSGARNRSVLGALPFKRARALVPDLCYQSGDEEKHPDFGSKQREYR
jgi:hypothetical protein